MRYAITTHSSILFLTDTWVFSSLELLCVHERSCTHLLVHVCRNFSRAYAVGRDCCFVRCARGQVYLVILKSRFSHSPTSSGWGFLLFHILVSWIYWFQFLPSFCLPFSHGSGLMTLAFSLGNSSVLPHNSFIQHLLYIQTSSWGLELGQI